MTLRTLNYGNYGIFLIVGNAGFCPSTVWWLLIDEEFTGFCAALHFRISQGLHSGCIGSI